MVSPTGSPPDPDSIRSLGVIHAELDRQQELFAARASSFDSKSGLVMATAGIMIGFQASHPSRVGACSAMFAVASGICTAISMRPVPGQEIEVRRLRADRVHRPPEETLLALVDTRLGVLKADEKLLLDKYKWINRGMLLLGVSALVLMIGLFDTDISSGADTTPRPPDSSSTTGPSTAGATRTVDTTRGNDEHPRISSSPATVVRPDSAPDLTRP